MSVSSYISTTKCFRINNKKFRNIIMNVHEITSGKQINEAPVGALKQMGRKIGAKAAGAVGMKGTAAGLSGAAETGDVARQLNVDLRKYAGQTGMNMKQLDAQDLAAFLKSKGFPTTPLANLTGVLTPKQVDQALLKAAQEKAKISGSKPGAGVAGSTAASGKPAPAGAAQPAQPAKAAQGGGVLDKIQQKTGKTGVGGGTTAPTAQPSAKPGAPDPAVAKQIETVKAKIQKLSPQQKKQLIGML